MATISQREARRLRKRVAELEARETGRNRRWATDYPGGVCIATFNVSSPGWHIVRTAKVLGHAVVVVPGDENALRLYAIGTKS